MSEQKLQINLKKISDALINGLNKVTNQKWEVRILNTGENVQIYKNSYETIVKKIKILAVVKENLVIKAKDYYSKIGTEIIPLELFHSTRNWENTQKDISDSKPHIKHKVSNFSSYLNEFNSFVNDFEVFNIKSDKYFFLYQLAKNEIDTLIKEEENRQKIKDIFNKKEAIEIEKNRINFMKAKIAMEENDIKKLQIEIENYKVIKDNELEV